MPSTNIHMLQIVAEGLGRLKDDVVFIGGAVAELYVDNPAAPEIRATFDVDCVVEVGSKLQFARMEEDLRAIGFTNDTSEGAPICRWVYQGIKVDMMPADPRILGFSNRWYEQGMETKTTKTLPNGTTIFVFPPEYYLAAKFEAHKGRGGNDLRQSHDFEDIIYILENCTDMLKNIKSSAQDVKRYLKEECQRLLTNPNITEGVESALPYGSGEEGTDIILGLIQNISEVE